MQSHRELSSENEVSRNGEEKRNKVMERMGTLAFHVTITI